MRHIRSVALEVLLALALVVAWGVAVTGLVMLALSLLGWGAALFVAGLSVFISLLVVALLVD